MGTIQNALGQKHEAQLHYERALPFLRQTGQPLLIAEALNDLGTIQSSLKQEKLAEDCYQEASSLVSRRANTLSARDNAQ